MSEVLSVKEKIGYGMGDAASHIIFDNVMLYMMFFYTDIFGIPAGFVGTMFLLARALDAISDPCMGLIADRTRSRWGKFRPWILFGAIPFGIVCVLAYTTPDLSLNGKMVYAAITYTLLTLLYTVVNIPYCALGGVITRDEKDRLSAQSYRFTISSLASLMVSVATLFLVDFLGKENKQFGFQATMGIMGAIAIVMLAFCFFSTKERVAPAVEQQGSIREDLRQLLANDQWRIVAIITFFSSMAGVMRSAATLYYATYLMLGGVESAAGTAMKSAFVSTSVVGTIIGSIAAGWLAKRYRAVSLFKNINLLLVLVGVVMFFVPPTWLPVVFPLYFLVGFFHQMYQPFKWNMMANAADYGEWKFGRRITGLSYSGNLFALKMGMAVAGAAVGFSLGLFGYQAGVTAQTPLATMGIVGLLTLGPSLSYLLLWWLARFYKLDDKMMQTIQRELSMRQQQAHSETQLPLNAVPEKA